MDKQTAYHHDKVIDQLIRWAQGNNAVRAMLLTSTRAILNAPVDVLSDYDVVLVVDNIHPFLDDKNWLEHFGKVLVAYWDPIYPDPDFGFEKFGNVVEYGEKLKIDFTLVPIELLERMVPAPTLPAELDAGYRVLLDKDQLTQGMPSPTYTAYIPKPPTNEAYQKLVNDFFSDVPYVAKCLWRSELLPAKWCLDFDMKHLHLRPMLEWKVGLDHNWSVPVGSLGKGLRKRLPAEIWSQLEDTYVGADMAENWDALFRTIALFRQIAVEVGKELNYTYPDQLDQRVTAYAQQIRRL